MAFTKITNSELNSRGATTLPNQPTISAAALKQEFDAPAKEIVAPHFNNLIDELEAETAAANIGIETPTGRIGETIQEVLNDVSTDLKNVEDAVGDINHSELEDAILKRHSHENKNVLDEFSVSAQGNLLWDGIPVGGGGSNYENLENKPQINGHQLIGNMSDSDLDLASASSVSSLVSAVGSMSSDLGIAQSRIRNLQEVTTQLSNDKADKSDLGTASSKNSTSVVTDSTDLVESGAVYDVVGWGNKNKLKMYPQTLTSGGLTAVISEDEVALSGTYTGNGEFRLVKDRNVADGVLYLPYGTYVYSIDKYDANINLSVGTTAPNGSYSGIVISTNAKSVEFTLDENTNSKYNADGKVGIIMYIQTKGQPTNTVFYPMICTAEEYAKSSEFEPYHVSVEQTLRDAEVVQGKNEADISDADKNFTLLKSGERTRYIYLNKEISAGNKILSIKISNASNMSLALRYQLLYNSTQVTSGNLGSTNNGVYNLPVNIASTINRLYLFISDSDSTNATCTVSDLMISVEGGDYEPYYIPLKDVVPNKCDTSVIAPTENGTTASQAYAVGSHFIRDGAFCTVTTAITSGESLVGSSKFTSGDVADSLLRLLPIFNNAGSHNGIFRGKNLGSSVTTAQKTAIANGSFEDLYIGDYWEINSVKYRIAHFDYWLNCGDGSNLCTEHHVVVVPDSALVNKRMNAKVNNVDTTAGAYANSEMRTTNLADAKTIVNAAFGADNILIHREYMQNAVTDGYESAGVWVNADTELMSEIMVYGSNIFHNVKCGTALPNLYTVNKTQLALFRLDPFYIICKNVAQTDRSYWWLRDVVSATQFAIVDNTSVAYIGGASSNFGVRPAFGIK